MTVPQRWLRLFLPFALGYFLSYLYRTANAVLGPPIAGELGLPDQALGLLTSAYFLTFGLAQIPLGVLLDRYGPRRVEAGLLLVAALGAVLFALASGLAQLTVGRALIGLGVSACLMASFKVFSIWFPPDRQAALTGWIMAAGALGALAGATPLAWALEAIGWRAALFVLAALTLAVALGILLLTPEPPTPRSAEPLRQQMAGVQRIFSSGHFWRYAPAAIFLTGGFMAVQGLWASRWMDVMEQMDRVAIAGRLGLIGLAMLSGFLFMGFFSTLLVRRGIPLGSLFRWAMVLSTLAFTALCLFPSALGAWAWPLLGACFAFSNIAYTLVAQAFPPTLSGRANTALNLMVFAGAFGLQWGIGIAVDFLQGADLSLMSAYRWTFAFLALCQWAALLPLLRPGTGQQAA